MRSGVTRGRRARALWGTSRGEFLTGSASRAAPDAWAVTALSVAQPAGGGLGEGGLGERGLGEGGLGEGGLGERGLGERGLGERGLGEGGLGRPGRPYGSRTTARGLSGPGVRPGRPSGLPAGASRDGSGSSPTLVCLPVVRPWVGPRSPRADGGPRCTTFVHSARAAARATGTKGVHREAASSPDALLTVPPGCRGSLPPSSVDG